jgi:glycosyltransferase involved in cell wall biosynthesis
MPALTVVLSSWRRPKGLRRALESLFAQTLTDWQCVLCDDASDHPDVDRLLDSASLDRRVSILRGNPFTPEEKANKVCTFGMLINQAVARTDSDFVAYLADGTTFEPDHLAQLVRVLNDDLMALVAWDAQRLVLLDDDGNEAEVREPSTGGAIEQWQGSYFEQRMSVSNFIDHCSIVERRNSYRWSEDPRHWTNLDHVRWREMAKANHRFVGLPRHGTTKYSSSKNLGRQIQGGNSYLAYYRANVK